MASLAQVSNERRARLMAHVDALPAIADEIGAGSEAAEAHLAESHAFLVTTLVPLMASVELALYPELDRLLSCRLAMTPLAREHEEIRSLIARIGRLRTTTGVDGRARQLETALRRLHVIISAHLLEESRYVPILEHNLDAGLTEALAGTMTGAAGIDVPTA